MMAMLRCCLLVIVLVGCQLHSAESAVTFPTDPVVVSISKNPAVNSAVATVTATDYTANTTLAYTLESQDPDTTPKVFSIDGASGAITVSNKTKLDYANTTKYTLVIKAAQSIQTSPKTGTTTVTVNLTNKEPTFAKALYTVCINKGSPAGTSVLQVTASDEDGDTLRYSITAGDGNSIFDVESANGTIKVDDKKTIGETPASYNLTLTATDNNQPSASGTTIVSISVDDPCPGVTPAPSFATTITASFCLFLISVSVHLLRIS